jgi:hypothetical protein
MGADSGGERAASMHSLIGTCKLVGIEPEAICVTSSSPTSQIIRSIGLTSCHRGVSPLCCSRRQPNATMRRTSPSITVVMHRLLQMRLMSLLSTPVSPKFSRLLFATVQIP